MAETKKKKLSKGKKAAIALSVIAGFIVAVIIAVSVLLFNFALNKDSSIHMSKLMNMAAQVAGDGAQTEIEFSGFVGTSKEQNWFFKNAEDITMESDDGLALHAYIIHNPSADGKFVITCHGYTSQSEYMAGFSRHFYDMGYSVLVPDARAHGQSEGGIIGMGWPERKDMLKWIGLLADEDPDVQIVLHGISMGGATVMMTSGEELPDNVKAIVEDCGYSSVFDEFKWQAASMFHIPAFPLLYTTSALSSMRAGYGFKEASATEQVKKCTLPMLFIHGDADDFVPFAMLDVVYEAATCEKEKLVIEGAGHGMASSTDPKLYWSTIKTFLEKHV